MTRIRAFVGHSFTDQDEALVRSFLTFFDQLEGLLDNFEWTHARRAEPKELANKVLESIEGCNTFIAICTRKELVISEDSLTSVFFRKNQVQSDRENFVWKTSDWVIQELGLARGRGLSAIILLEDGCRKPGGLQGDVEYIPFDRSAPEKAQGKLIEMIKALSPPSASGTPKAESKQDDNQATVPDQENDEEGKPDASWDVQKFEDQYFWAVVRKKNDRADEIHQAFLASVHAKSDEQRAEWVSKSESYKLIWGGDGKLSEIRRHALEYPENPRILSSLASSISQLDQENEAAALYEKAANLESENAKAIGHLNSAAYFYMKAGKRSKSEDVIEQIKAMRGPDDLAQVASTLRSMGSVAEDKHLEIEAMEAIARSNPDDHDNRFSLAYAHSQVGNSDLALHHYLIIPTEERSAVTWNNLGVAYQDLSIPGMAVAAYKKSASEGETLAMSNLAYRYMNAGFFEEANGEIRRAMAQNEPHRNVGEAYARLQDLPGDENESLKEIDGKASQKIEFYRRLSQAILQPTLKTIPADWIGPKGPISMSVVGNDFAAVWEYQTEGNALIGLLASKPNRYRIELNGKMLGRRAYGKLKETRLDGVPSILGDLDRDRSFAIVFDDDLKSAQVVENLEKRFPNFYGMQIADQNMIAE